MKIASITHCSALKAIPSQIAPNGMSGGQASIASDWLSKVKKVRTFIQGADIKLYCRELAMSEVYTSFQQALVSFRATALCLVMT